MQRIQIQGIRKDPWFRKNYLPVKSRENREVNLDDVNAVFNDIEVGIILHSIIISRLESSNALYNNICDVIG